MHSARVVSSCLRAGRGVVVGAAGLAVVGSLLSAFPAAADEGNLSLTPGRSAGATMAASFADGSSAVTFKMPSLPGVLYASVNLRSSGTGAYRAKTRIDPNGAVTASLVRATNAGEAVLATKPLRMKAKAGTRLRVQVRAIGSDRVSLKMRTWRAGADRPDWQLAVSDTSPARITGAGRPALLGYLSGSASRGVRLPYGNWNHNRAGDGMVDGDDDGSGGVVTTPTPSAGERPTPSNTGVPAGTPLTRHDGDITVTQPGTVLKNMDIHGFVTIKADNVTIKNSILRGGTATYNRGIVTNYGYKNLVVEDSDFLPKSETVWQDGMKGNNFTLRRVHITGNVDSVKIHTGGNVTIAQSLLENTTSYASDPNQGGGSTHNDGIQILDGANITIVGNTVRGHGGFAVLGAANKGNVPNLVVKDNWLDGGHCTTKFEEFNGWNVKAAASGNKFGPNRKVNNCAIVRAGGADLGAANNVWEGTGAQVAVTND